MKFLLLWKFFALAFSALLPLVNPLGSALLFVGFVGEVPISLYRSLARRIAINIANASKCFPSSPNASTPPSPVTTSLPKPSS